MSTRFLLFAVIGSLFFTSSLAHYPANQQTHQHYARQQVGSPVFPPPSRRSATPTLARRSATPVLARRSATPTLSALRASLQRRYEHENLLAKRQAPSPLPSGMLSRRQAISSPLPSARKRSPDEQSNWDTMYALSRERRSWRAQVEEDETNARRIKRGDTPLPPRGFSLKSVGGTLRFLPDQKPSQTIKLSDAENSQDAVVRTGAETRFKPATPNIGAAVVPSA